VSVERWALTRMVDWKNAAAVRDAAGI